MKCNTGQLVRGKTRARLYSQLTKHHCSLKKSNKLCPISAGARFHAAAVRELQAGELAQGVVGVARGGGVCPLPGAGVVQAALAVVVVLLQAVI